jgi:hypothetical protein
MCMSADENIKLIFPQKGIQTFLIAPGHDLMSMYNSDPEFAHLKNPLFWVNTLKIKTTDLFVDVAFDTDEIGGKTFEPVVGFAVADVAGADQALHFVRALKIRAVPLAL